MLIVTFYFLDAYNAQRTARVTRLVERAFDAGMRTEIRIERSEDVAKLEETLWKQLHNRFIPISSTNNHGNEPWVYIRNQDKPRLGFPHLINLHQEPPKDLDHFQFISELVDNTTVSGYQRKIDQYRSHDCKVVESGKRPTARKQA